MKLFNTFSRSLEDFKPQDDSRVSVYTCGPTVYDSPHIGNWFAFLRWDILVRTLQSAGYPVTWVMNITDVGHLVSDGDEGEDKLEVGAKREGTTAWDIAARYTQEFMDGLLQLNFIQPGQLPKATDHIQEQIDLIARLEEKGYTYRITDGIYFDTSKFASYGELAHLDLEHLKSSARIEPNPEKKQATDFALWKFSPAAKKRDMEWDSPWGTGFPGWHIECSAMSMKYLGETLDIHGGGIDHLPIHHTNERAQSEAATGKPFVHYWLHANFILVEGKKMSKSLNNFYTLHDVIDKGFDPLAFRLLALQSHYRTESQFSWDNLQAAQNRLKGYQQLADLRFQPVTNNAGTNQLKLLEEFKKSFQQALQHDLDTPQALEELSVLATTLRETLIDQTALEAFSQLMEYIDQCLGLQLSTSQAIGDQQKQLLAQRQTARDKQAWQQADEVRQQLDQQGIGVRDTSYGQVWYRL